MDGIRVIKIDPKDIGSEDRNNKYAGLRDLWCRVFGDEPGFVDFFYESFGGDITGYVICNDAGKVISALTCFRCGVFRDPSGNAEGRPALDAVDDQARDTEDAEDGQGDGADGLPVYVSYAICTDPEYRGHGYAAALTDYVRKVVTAPRGTVIYEEDDRLPAAEGLGGISLVSPAEESLVGYYDGLGYRENFFVDEHLVRAGADDLPGDEDEFAGADFGAISAADTGRFETAGDTRFWGLGPDGNADFLDDEEGEAFEPELSVESVSGSMYNRYREEFLADITHVEMSPEMMEFLRADGDGGLLVINGGDAICRVAYAGAGVAGEADGKGAEATASGKTVMLDELLVNPQLLAFSEEIGEEIAEQLAEYFGAETLVYRTPGFGRCQTMSNAEAVTAGAYFGFPIE